MRYEDASNSFQASGPNANDDSDTLPAGSREAATGNLISGEGTQYGAAGADSAAGGHVTSIAGKGGEDSSFAGGKLSVAGEYGKLSVDAEGNYNYMANKGAPENVRDRFTYTLADNQGGSDTAALIIELGKTPVVIKADAQQVVPGPDGVVTLPPGVDLSDVMVVGRNLVINMPDGTQLIIVDGAIFVPQLVLDGVSVPATNVAALLIGQEPQPAAGELPPSSGGNFALPPPPLDPGVPLGDLLPPTVRDYIPPEPQEVFDELDRDPTVVIQPVDQAPSINAVDSVDEKGLPTRNGGEPEGSGEGADGNPSNNSDGSEATSGTIIIDSPDGVDSVTITGADGVPHEIVVGLVVEGEFGTLTITGIVGDDYTYSYVLNDNTSGDDTQDDFSVTLTDDDGDVAVATLTIDIIDDVPTARNDTDAVIKGETSTDGNVMTGTGTTSGAAGSDTVGADNAEVTGIHAGASGSFTAVPDAGVTIVGQFGDLTINPDGSYTYTLHAEVGDGGTDVFTYRLTDGDGDTEDATLTINVPPDLKPTLDAPNVGEAGTVVDEKGLPARNEGEPEGTGEEAAPGPNGDSSEITTGVINFTPGDTPATITINGLPVTGIGDTFAGDYGTLEITGFNPNGSITYIYTLNDNVDHDTDLTPFEEFDIVVTDDDGDVASDTLRIDIVDDAPIANDDTDSVTEDGPLVADGNVLTGVGSDGNPAGDDLVGADDSIVTDVDGLNPGVGSATATPGGVAIVGQYGTLVIHSDGSYTYTLDNTDPDVQALSDGDTLLERFEYTILDNDGDTDTAILTITINGDNDVPTVLVPTRGEDGTIVDEAGLPPRGSEPEGTGEGADGLPNNESDDSEVTSGVISYTPGDGATTITIGGVTITGPFPQNIPGEYGTLSITAHDPVAHTISYTYTLSDNIDHSDGLPDFESFEVVVSDSDGNPADDATGDLIIDIVNDAPIANPDTDSVVEGQTTDGNVLTGVGTTSGASGVDVPGADDFAPNTVVGVAAGDTGNNLNSPGTVGVQIAGAWGTLTLNADGSYTYEADADTNPPPGSEDVFTYTIIDQDGNESHTTLTIDVIDDLTPSANTPDLVIVDDDDVPGANGNPGTPPVNDDAPQNTSGTLTGTGGDGDLDFYFNVAATDAGLPAGFDVGPGSTSSQIIITQGGVPVLTITLDNETGQYTVVQNAPIDHADGNLENNQDFNIVFYAQDVDTDQSAPANLTVRVDDDSPIAAVVSTVQTVSVDETAGIQGDSNDTTNAGVIALFSGVSNKGTDGDMPAPQYGQSVSGVVASTGSSYGADGAGTTVFSLDVSAAGVDSGLDTTAGASIFLFKEGSLIVGRVGDASGPAAFAVAINPSTGVVSMVEYMSINHPNPANPDESVSIADGAILATVTVTDSDNDPVSSSVGIGDQIQFQDDAPTAGVVSLVQTVSVDETAGIQGDSNDTTNAGVIALFAGVATKGTDPDMPAPQYGQSVSGLVAATGSAYGADGAGTTVFSLSVSAAGVDSGLDTTAGVSIFLFLENGLVVGRAGADAAAAATGPAAFAVAINPSTGVVSMVEYMSIKHLDPTNPDDTVSIADGAILATVTVTDGDNDVATTSVGIGDQIQFQDDGPTAVIADDITTGLVNEAGGTASALLDGGGNDIVGDNFGADGGKVIFTDASIDAMEAYNFENSGDPLIYEISPDGQMLRGFVDNGDGEFGAGDTSVIRIQLQTGTGGNFYTVTMDDTIDTTVTFQFTDEAYDFVGGNDTWAGFALNDQVDGKAGDTPVDDNSKDLLLTPLGTGTAVNGNATSAGTTGPIAGQNIGDGEGMRVDYVSDLTGIPTTGTYADNAERTHDFDNHYLVEAAVLKFDQGTSTETTVSFKALLVTDQPDEAPGDDNVADPVTGTGSLVSVESVAISYGGETGTVTFDLGDLEQSMVVGGRTYTVQWVLDGGTGEYFVEVTGVYDDNVQMAFFGDVDYNALELLHLGPSDADADFAITGFGFATGTAADLDFSVPISVVDGDGDTVSSGTLDIHADAADLAGFAATSLMAESSESSDTSSFSSLAYESQSEQLQKSAANANTLTLATAVAAAGLSEPVAAHDNGNHNGHGQNSELSSLAAAETVERYSASDDSDGAAVSLLAPEASTDASGPADTSSSSSSDNESADHSVDESAAHAAPESNDAPAADEGGSHSSADAVNPVAPTVAMVSAEALQAAADDVGDAQKGGSVEKVVAEALHDGGSDVDAVLANLPGGNGGLQALAHMASPDVAAVSGWHMGGHGSFGGGHDMMFKMDVATHHQDAVQPVQNG